MRRSRQSGFTLTELLVVLVVGTIVSGLIIVGWISLTTAYSHNTRSSKSRDDARLAVARISREIRDAEPNGGATAIISATAGSIVFTTTFNVEGNTSATTKPVLTKYEYDTATQSLHRWRDFQGDGSWDRDDVVVRHLENKWDPATRTFLVDPFEYGTMDSEREITFSASPAGSTASIKMVRIHLLVDQNDERAPVPMDLVTTVQLRNQPRF